MINDNKYMSMMMITLTRLNIAAVNFRWVWDPDANDGEGQLMAVVINE